MGQLTTKHKQNLCGERKRESGTEETKEQDFHGTISMSRPVWLLVVGNVVSMGKYLWVRVLYDSMLCKPYHCVKKNDLQINHIISI